MKAQTPYFADDSNYLIKINFKNTLIMRKFLLAIIAILVYGQILAQEDHTHLKFMGIPIDGPISTFVKQLEQKDFTTKTDNDKAVFMEGVFANKDCEIFVVPTQETKIVWKVAVIYKQEYTNWSSIQTDFDDIKELYTRKYGQPAYDYHFFSSPYELGDGYEMSALKLDKCKYFTAYKLKSGYISIQMISSCQIMISYEDAINSDIDTQESEKAILEDI